MRKALSLFVSCYVLWSSTGAAVAPSCPRATPYPGVVQVPGICKATALSPSFLGGTLQSNGTWQCNWECRATSVTLADSGNAHAVCLSPAVVVEAPAVCSTFPFRYSATTYYSPDGGYNSDSGYDAGYDTYGGYDAYPLDPAVACANSRPNCAPGGGFVPSIALSVTAYNGTCCQARQDPATACINDCYSSGRNNLPSQDWNYQCTNVGQQDPILRGMTCVEACNAAASACGGNTGAVRVFPNNDSTYDTGGYAPTSAEEPMEESYGY